MYMYVQRPGCKKENTATHVYIRAGSRTPTRTYVRPGLVYMAGSERRNNVVVVFMGRQQNASCSWGGNEMRRVHGEAAECVMFMGRQWNAWEPTGWVRTKCVVVFIGRAWTKHAMETRPGVPQNGGNGLVFDRPCSKRDPVHWEGSGVPQNGGNEPPTVETGVLLIGRGVAYRKTEETDLLQSKRGSC